MNSAARLRLSAMAACAFAVALSMQPAAAAPPVAPDWTDAAASARMIVVAISDRPDPAPAAGATPRGYSGLAAYSGSDRAAAAMTRIAREYALREVSAWTIASLRLRCVVLEIPADGDRATLLARLADDRRIRLAQPLQDFSTLTSSPSTAAAEAGAARYNDPYFSLQNNLLVIESTDAQRWTLGEGVRIAIIDAGVDVEHVDFSDGIVSQRDFVDPASTARAADRHGTEVAGVIAAVANNGVGIVGVAPAARLSAYRACWPLQAEAGSARCNSYTLAVALGAAIDDHAQIINLSLGGPADPLLTELIAHALDRGIVIVGAVPPDGRMDGFPVGISGVIAVAASGDARIAPTTLTAPGADILTLQPGGGFDYASGSSLAAAQVSGAFALLLSLQPRLDSAALHASLARSQGGPGRTINACKAVAELRRSDAPCGVSPGIRKVSRPFLP